jgi:hypothetical protein
MPKLTCNPSSVSKSHEYINSACFALPTTLGVNGDYHMPFTAGPGYFNSDLALQKQVGLGENRNLQFRFSAFNWLNYANRTFTTSIDPNALNLNFSNSASGAQPADEAISSATNSNASIFGFAPNRVGRRVTEAMIKFNF